MPKNIGLAALEANGDLLACTLLAPAPGVVGGDLLTRRHVQQADMGMVAFDSSGAGVTTDDACHAAGLPHCGQSERATSPAAAISASLSSSPV